MIYLIFIFFCYIVLLSSLWEKHSEWMQKNHPDLKNKSNDDRSGDEGN